MQNVNSSHLRNEKLISLISDIYVSNFYLNYRLINFHEISNSRLKFSNDFSATKKIFECKGSITEFLANIK